MKNAIQDPKNTLINSASFLENLMPKIKISQINLPLKGIDPIHDKSINKFYSKVSSNIDL